MSNDAIHFYSQQLVVSEWAEDVHLDLFLAEEAATRLSALFGFPRPRLHWEARGLVSRSNDAVTIRNPRTETIDIYFPGHGCTLLTLCHELVHSFRPWNENFHDFVDWDLCIIFLEECRDLDW